MDIHLLKRLPLRNLNPEVDFRFYGRHLEKSIWRHNSDASRLVGLLQNLAGWSKITV